MNLKKFVFGGFGLNASAAALDQSAAALTAAAARLAAVGAAGGAMETAKGVAKAGAPAAASAGFWARGAAALPFTTAIGLPALLLAASYPLTQDANNPGAGESRRARGKGLRDATIASYNADRDRMGIPRLGSAPTEVTGTAEVKGEIKIEVEDKRVTVKGGDSVWVSGDLPLHGPGSVGKSSPDARPGWRGTIGGY